MAEIRQNSCCKRAISAARLADHSPTIEDIAWLFSMSPRWVRELRRRGMMDAADTLPKLVKRMARYKPEAKGAARRARLAKRDG